MLAAISREVNDDFAATIFYVIGFISGVGVNILTGCSKQASDFDVAGARKIYEDD